MTTSYPGEVDSFTNPAAADKLSSPSHAGQHANANDAIEAIQNELGTNPSGSSSTVAERLGTLATSASVTAAINAVIDSAPGALDTLNELAAALGDDAAFATTVTNALAAKVAAALYDANTILKADADNTPVAVTIGEQTIVGRVTGGQIAALSASQAKTLLAIGEADVTGLVTDLAAKAAGAASSTDNALPRFDGTGGKTLQGSGVTVDDSNNVTIPGTTTASGFIVGASGPKLLSGTGSPESAVTAPVGSIWVQTDSSVGVTHWRKATGSGSTGWVVMAGDTGARAVTLENGWTATHLNIRRIGSMVDISVYGLNGTSATAPTFYTLPSGFRVPQIRSELPYAGTLITSETSGALIAWGTSASYTAGRAAMAYVTSDAWPSSLPGSAA